MIGERCSNHSILSETGETEASAAPFQYPRI
jgi:hypothetical protein